MKGWKYPSGAHLFARMVGAGICRLEKAIASLSQCLMGFEQLIYSI
ncbi:hypothetical protein IQ268_16025 [Oculatella sp. LEGE 06141]|nr:hypothetical protein [Oculatella sp. LEGE 06141]